MSGRPDIKNRNGLTAEAVAANIAAGAVDRSALPRVIITTDLEVDDENGILLTLMYADQFDLAGIVWTAGMFHFNGDGVHTLAEITPNYRCEASTAGGSVKNAGELKSFRPVDPGLLRRIIDVNYRSDYRCLSLNNPNYPTPDELLSITKTGNVEFEGDYRFETEGSEHIKKCILDDDMRPLYIQHWGGINTTVRALMSIYEEYHDTDSWEKVLAKVIAKVRLDKSGEDNCRADSGIDRLFPGLVSCDLKAFGSYGNYFNAVPFGKYSASFLAGDREITIPLGTGERLNRYYRAPYLTDAFKFGHGQVLGRFHLMNDGQVIYGEPMPFQYGLINYIDWNECAETGYGAAFGWPRIEFDTFDWMCCQFETDKFVDLGLRRDIDNRDERYTVAMFDELAARADWAVAEPVNCNHAPSVSLSAYDITAAPGETVRIAANVSDPDGDEVTVRWFADDVTGSGNGRTGMSEISGCAALNTEFTVPADARHGDRFVITAEAKDNAGRPMTRYAQALIIVD